MKENVGRADRIARAVIGPGLMMLGFTWMGGKSRWPALAALVGGTLLMQTAVTRVCPLNALLKLDSRAKQERGYELSELPREAPQPLLPQA